MSFRVGVDIGGTAVKVGLVDSEYRLLASRKIATNRNFEACMREIANEVMLVAEEASVPVGELASVGVAVPSFVSPKTGRLVFFNNVNWRDVPLKEELSRYFPVPVFVGNDANCAAVGEAVAGGGTGYDNILMLTLGTGVGGGILLNGRLFTGGDGLGAELGHTPLIAGGEECTCGISGCLEAYASVTALLRDTKREMEKAPDSLLHTWVREHGELTGRGVFDCAHQNDPAVLRVLDRYTDYVANGAGGFVNVFRPDILLIGGGISEQGEYLISPIREKLAKYVLASDSVGVPLVRPALLGNRAGIIGAACLGEK